MEVLRKAMRRSPNLTKEKKSRHEKLAEGWNENKEAVSEGITFYLKYLGATLVEEAEEGESYGDKAIKKAIQSIIAMAKSSGKKLRKVALTASPGGVKVIDMNSKEILDEVSIYRISFCSANKDFDKVFAMMARNSINETMECHAYLCAKPKIAQAVTLTVSKAFELAKDRWNESKSSSNNKNGVQQANNLKAKCDKNGSNKQSFSSSSGDSEVVPRLSGPDEKGDSRSLSPTQSTDWMQFEDDNLDDGFSKLAEVRSRGPPTLHTNLSSDNLEEDDSVTQYMDSNRCLEELSRTKSVEDLQFL